MLYSSTFYYFLYSTLITPSIFLPSDSLLQPLTDTSPVCVDIVRKVVEEGEAVVLRDCASSSLLAKYAALRGPNVPGSLMCVPIIYKGTTMGEYLCLPSLMQ